jgi:A118 family predicted phage portal protein
MGLLNFIRGKIKMLFKTDAESAFEVKTYLSSEMETAIQTWRELEGANGYKPPWVGGDIKTIRFSNTIARELASLIVQNIDIKAQAAQLTAGGEPIQTEGGEVARRSGGKAEMMQDAIDKDFLSRAQEIIERVIRLGGIMAKWDGEGIEYISDIDRFRITDYDSDGTVTGAIFYSYYTDIDKYYTRAEWHRFETHTVTDDETGETTAEKKYKISNKAFVSDEKEELGREISLKKTQWADFKPEVSFDNLEKPLFVYMKTPYSNTIDTDSPLGCSIFSECIEELRWLDIAMSTMGVETEDSKPVMFVSESAVQYAHNMGIKLPRFVRGVEMGINADGNIEQWTPTMQVQNRIDGINFYLSILSYKCGFDASYFSFDGNKINFNTATAVEASEQRTINTVMTYRNLLDRPKTNGTGRIGYIHDIAYILDAMMTLNKKSVPGEFGNYEIYADFADLTASEEEDRAFDYQLTQNNYMSKVRFLVLHRGLTEEEARAWVAEAQAESAANKDSGLFGEE